MSRCEKQFKRFETKHKWDDLKINFTKPITPTITPKNTLTDYNSKFYREPIYIDVLLEKLTMN